MPYVFTQIKTPKMGNFYFTFGLHSGRELIVGGVSSIIYSLFISISYTVFHVARNEFGKKYV